MYPRDIDVVNSTAAARVNGYIGGHGTLEEVQAVIENLGLSPASQQRLLALAKRWKN
jgi:peptide-methionine (S)-S-oxide reductase